VLIVLSLRAGEANFAQGAKLTEPTKIICAPGYVGCRRNTGLLVGECMRIHCYTRKS
jgi:hypothetical protein